MSHYTEYLDRNMNFQALTAERKKQLSRIAELRGRDLLVYAADFDKPDTPASKLMISYEDLLPISDQVSKLNGKKIDLLLETGGGSGEVAEDIVRLLHAKYDEVAVIVPGWAKSAGTIVAMAGDEILMGPTSALGPIDAQVTRQGKVFSADALLEGMDKIKKDVKKTGSLNRAYIPMLQALSPGELQGAQNALDFAKTLVTEWLVVYKFKNWTTHSSTGKKVTPAERKMRAARIARELCNHRKWKTHARSIKIADLEAMRLKITDYSRNPDLADAIGRYHTLLQMTFDSTNIYKVFETPDSQIIRFIGPPVPGPQEAEIVILDVLCPGCKAGYKIQGNLSKNPLQAGHHRFPMDNKFTCPTCKAEIDLTGARRQIEVQSKKPILNEYT